MPLTSTLCLIPDLDMCPRHLPDLTDLAALATDHAANQLGKRQKLTLSMAQNLISLTTLQPLYPLLTSLGTKNSWELVCAAGSSPKAEERN